MIQRPAKARTRRGWLRAEQLMSGLEEQHAVLVEKTKHVVTLRHHAHDDTFRVNHTVDAPGQEFPEGNEWSYPARALDSARARFTEQVRQLSQ